MKPNLCPRFSSSGHSLLLLDWPRPGAAPKHLDLPSWVPARRSEVLPGRLSKAGGGGGTMWLLCACGLTLGVSGLLKTGIRNQNEPVTL